MALRVWRQICALVDVSFALHSMSQNLMLHSWRPKTQCMQAAGQHCILVTRGEETGQCNVILCDAIGTPVDSNATMVEPLCLTMTSTHVVAASVDTVFVWLYSSASGEAILELVHALCTPLWGVVSCQHLQQ